MFEKLLTFYNAAQMVDFSFDPGSPIAFGGFNDGNAKSTDVNRVDWPRVCSNRRNYGR